MENLDLSIIIVTYNTENVTLACLDSIQKSKTNLSFEIIVVDNNSTDNTVNQIGLQFPLVKLIRSEKNNGFAIANNLGIEKSLGKYIMLLNSDTLLLEDSIEALINSAVRNNYDITGPILLNKDLSLQRSWFNYPSPTKIFFRLTEIYKIFYKLSSTYLFKLIFSNKQPAFMIKEIDKNTSMNYLSFACIMINKKIFEIIGLLDEDLIFYHEDCEYGIRAKKFNIEIIYNVESKIIHLGGTSSSNLSLFAFENDIKGLLHVFKKHYSTIELNRLKIAITMALGVRIFLWHFGLFKQIKKIGLYYNTNKDDLKNDQRQLLIKYKILKKEVSNFI